MIVIRIINFDLPGAVLSPVEPDFELAAGHTCAALSLYTFAALYATLITTKISPTDLRVSLAFIFDKLLPREPISTLHGMLFDSNLGARERRVFFFAWRRQQAWRVGFNLGIVRIHSGRGGQRSGGVYVIKFKKDVEIQLGCK